MFIRKTLTALILSSTLAYPQDGGSGGRIHPEFDPATANPIDYFLQSLTRPQAFQSSGFWANAVLDFAAALNPSPEGSSHEATSPTADSYLVSEPGKSRVLLLDGCDNSVLETYTGPSGINFGSSLAAADLDGNGFMDVLVGAKGGAGAGSITVFRRGPGVFGGFILGTTNGNFAHRILVADLDGDGTKEIIVSDHIHNGPAGTNAGWVGIYDAETLVLKTEMDGTVQFGQMGTSMATGLGRATLCSWSVSPDTMAAMGASASSMSR
ncbi:MAG: FG-GAP repeat domain-containing protein [Planctomycetota bacterium]|jgi:hypothetical protein